MEPTLYRYVFRHSKRQQVILLILTLFSFPFLYISLDLPKTIINQAIGGREFPREFLGIPFQQVEYLLVLSFAFLALVLVNGGFKYVINVFKGRLGEGMLRRLRYELFARVLRFPLPHFRRLSQGEIIAMISSEVEPLGGFIGDSVAQPLFQGGTLVTILVFMFVQDPVLGAAAIALYPFQAYLIPKLQRRVNALGKERVRAVRKLSERLGESVAGVQEIHAHDTAEYERAGIATHLGKIYAIRYQIYQKKFVIKFINNFLAQVTPFFFYAIGGYLVIAGDLTFGALVAVLAAYKDLSSPWKELLDFYQQKEDAKIKYEQLVDQFHTPGMLDAALQPVAPDLPPPLEGAVAATNVALEEEGGIKIVDGVNVQLDLTARAALVGAGGPGRSALVRLLARLLLPTSGAISVGGKNLATLPEPVTGRRLAFVDQSAYMFAGTIRDNVLYGLKHAPLRPPAEGDPEAKHRRERLAADASANGNTPSDLDADWIDYAAAGVNGPDGLDEALLDALAAVEMREEIYELGLQGRIDPAERAIFATKVLAARGGLHAGLVDPRLRGLVEPFDRARYNVNMSVAENLLFGLPVGETFNLERIGEHPYVRKVLEQAGLTERFLDAGLQIATIMLDLFRDLPSDHEYFERFSFVSADELPELRQLMQTVESGGKAAIEDGARARLSSLTFKLVPGRHRLGIVDDELQQRILDARRAFAADLPVALRPAVAFFDEASYNAVASVQDNILFGRMVFGRAQARQQIGRLIRDAVEQQSLRRDVEMLGLEMPVGVAGSRLTPSQRQRIALARALIKRPDLLLLDDPLSSVDPGEQRRIMAAVVETRRGRGLLWVLARPEDAQHFDRVIVMAGGKIVEQGTYAELNKPGTQFLETATGSA